VGFKQKILLKSAFICVPISLCLSVFVAKLLLEIFLHPGGSTASRTENLIPIFS
jgi:hypothetical protein